MRFIYFGSSQFSEVVLEELCLKGYKPTLIVSKPDKPKGRGLKLSSTKVSQFAKLKKIPFIKPASLKKGEVKGILGKEQADFFIVADYGEVIPKDLLVLPSVFALCIHPSLLPGYRGATPIEETLMNGDKKSGVTIFKMNERVDAGDIILQKAVTVNYEDDFFSLSQKLAKEGALLLIEAIKKIENKKYSLTLQDEKIATLTSKFKKDDGKISWESSAKNIRNLIRATLGWPSAYTFYQGMMIKILTAEVIDQGANDSPGVIVETDKEGIYVATGKGILKIKRLKPQGKSEMDAWSFICGYRIKKGEIFGTK
ncbi:MAG: methionyl-tRNA formyltransferase [Candidatus Omnitrophica bacterium]|nr:methionyl-tRNA formyltransferase [Candidatus Omnitrophota bacterium]